MYICIHTHTPLSKLYDGGDHICIFVSFIVAHVIFFMNDSPYSKGGHMISTMTEVCTDAVVPLLGQ